LENTMKRIIITAIALSVVAALGFAQSTAKEQTSTADKTQTQTVTKGQRGANFIDADGDGVCDNFQTKAGGQGKQGKGMGKGAGKGMGNGTCTGSGAGTGTGVCDGTGPKGYRGGTK
jgi:hypothetical protein